MVMLVMCIAAAIAVPSMRGFGENQRIRGCTAQLVALAQWARAQAITHGVPHRLNLDPATNTYWLTIERAGVFEPVGQDFGRTFTAPDGVTVQCYGAAGTGSQYPYVEFLATGRTNGSASIVLTDAHGNVTEIAALSAAEPFRVLSDAERVMR